LQIKQAGSVLRAVKHIRGGLVDRHCAAASRRIRNLPRMQTQSIETKLAISHGFLVGRKGAACRDDAGVDTKPAQSAKKTGVLDLDAAVHNDC